MRRPWPNSFVRADLPSGLGIRGVGRGTVELMLIFMQDRLDVLPIEDYGVRNGFSNATGREVRVTSKELKRLGSEWSPCRSVIAWYFWREANIT